MKNKFKALEKILDKPIAHRGLHNEAIDENSISSFKRAIDKGVPIELDVRLLKSGEVVVMHDLILDRVAGEKGKIKRLTLEELKQYRFSKTNEQIPLLKEVLEFVDGRVPILIELKYGKIFKKKLALETLKTLEEYKYPETIALQSFHPRAVKYIKSKTDKYPVGFLSERKHLLVRPIKHYYSRLTKLNKIKPDFISYNIDNIDNKYAKSAKDRGYPLLAWTVDSKDKLEKAKKYADNFIFENDII